MAGTHNSRRSSFLVDYPDVPLYTVRHLFLTITWPAGQGASVGALTKLEGNCSRHFTSANINTRNVHRSKAVTDLLHNILEMMYRDSKQCCYK